MASSDPRHGPPSDALSVPLHLVVHEGGVLLEQRPPVGDQPRLPLLRLGGHPADLPRKVGVQPAHRPGRCQGAAVPPSQPSPAGRPPKSRCLKAVPKKIPFAPEPTPRPSPPGSSDGKKPAGDVKNTRHVRGGGGRWRHNRCFPLKKNHCSKRKMQHEIFF